MSDQLYYTHEYIVRLCTDCEGELLSFAGATHEPYYYEVLL